MNDKEDEAIVLINLIVKAFFVLVISLALAGTLWALINIVGSNNG